MANGKELQDRAAGILHGCCRITEERGVQYGGDVFKQTAKIHNAIFEDVLVTAEMVHRIMFCMKLARYGFQIMLKNNKSEITTRDSIIDANVYGALMESERQLRNESQSEAHTTE